MNISLSPFVPENLVSRDGFGSPVPRQHAHLHTQAESGAYLRDSSRVPRRRPFIYFKPPYAIGSVPSLSGHAIAYRWRSLPRVHRHRASKPHVLTRLYCHYYSPNKLQVDRERHSFSGNHQVNLTATDSKYRHVVVLSMQRSFYKERIYITGVSK